MITVKFLIVFIMIKVMIDIRLLGGVYIQFQFLSEDLFETGAHSE